MSKTDLERLITRLSNGIRKKPYVRMSLSRTEVAELLQTVVRLQVKEEIEEVNKVIDQ